MIARFECPCCLHSLHYNVNSRRVVLSCLHCAFGVRYRFVNYDPALWVGRVQWQMRELRNTLFAGVHGS